MPHEHTFRPLTLGRVGDGKLHVLARGIRMWRVNCESGALMLCAAIPDPDASSSEVDCKRCRRDIDNGRYGDA